MGVGFFDFPVKNSKAKKPKLFITYRRYRRYIGIQEDRQMRKKKIYT